MLVQLGAELQVWSGKRVSFAVTRLRLQRSNLMSYQRVMFADSLSLAQSRARMVVRVGFGLQEWQFAGLSVCWSAARCAGVAVWRLIHVPWEDSACKRDR